MFRYIDCRNILQLNIESIANIDLVPFYRIFFNPILLLSFYSRVPISINYFNFTFPLSFNEVCHLNIHVICFGI